MKRSLRFLLIGFALFTSCNNKKHAEVNGTTENDAKTVSSIIVKDSTIDAKKEVAIEEKYSKGNLKGYYFEDVDSTSAIKIHDKVWHYLMKVDKKWIKDQLNDPHFYYTAEHQERDSINYCVIRLTREQEGMQTTIKWLYLNLEKDKIYEYDLPNDELILFTR